VTDGSKLLVDQARPHGHLVQLHEAGETSLVDNVAGYFAEGIMRHQGAVIVAAPNHRETFLDALKRSGTDVDAALARQALELGAPRLEACNVVGRGERGLALRQQKIATETRAYLHAIADVAEIGNLLQQDDFHDGEP